jgi:protein TonB
MRGLALLAMMSVAIAGLARAAPPDQVGSATLGDVAPPPPLEAAPTIITNPDWVRRPTAEEMANYFPPVPELLALGGHATIVCAVEVSGDVDQCQVVAETPAGMGFGAAAVALSRTFKMKPMTRDGVAVGAPT